jgi:hypothetical protein
MLLHVLRVVAQLVLHFLQPLQVIGVHPIVDVRRRRVLLGLKVAQPFLVFLALGDQLRDRVERRRLNFRR